MTFGITANLDKDDVHELVPKVLKWLQSRKVDFVVEPETAQALSLQSYLPDHLIAKSLEKQCDMILSFGGDGTILSTAHKFGRSGIPILGIKIGGMGFLADLTTDELFSKLNDILNGQYDVVERIVLKGELENKSNSEFYALNDFVLDKGAISRVIRIKTYIDDEYLNTYIGDGLIISTPTGSTAYSLAVGGPILLPTMAAIIINPISPHTLGARPVVVPAEKEVRIVIDSTPAQVPLSADGRPEAHLVPGEAARFSLADYRVKLVSYRGRSFYDVLRAKLNWGEDVREE